MKRFDDPLFQSLADRALELVNDDDTLRVVPAAT